MRKNIARKNILNYVFPILLILFSVVLALLNFRSNTWLTGWDNLHPEFDIILNIKRSLFTVWQEYQGLGLLGGMSHAADLPRQIILLIFGIFLPENILRYIWVFLMLVIGPLGVYFLLSKNLLVGNNKLNINSAAFIGGLIYLLNLATVQYFFTPYESFVSFYGFLPWLIFYVINYLQNSTWKNLIIFFFLSLLASSAFYVQTLFVVYVIILSAIFLETLFRQKIKSIKKILFILGVVVCVNSFWLLPSGYFSLTSGDLVTNSKINSVATLETKLMNEDKANMADVTKLKGFWFDYLDTNSSDKFDYLLSNWRNHLENPLVNNFLYFIFALSVIGMVLSLSYRKSDWGLSMAFVMGTSVFMLMGESGLTGSLFVKLGNNIPFFAQSFRSVFTKWSPVMAFSIALGVGYFLNYVFGWIKGRMRYFPLIIVSVFSAMLIFSFLPAFKGELVMDKARIEIPDEYFEMFDYFKGQPKERRIAMLPIHTFWGWEFHDWGYRGSGFVWYGIEQPILSRTFDVWSPYNETFYNQMSDAIYSNDPSRVREVIDKYNVSYLLVDKSIFLPDQDSELFSDDMVKLIEDSGGAEAFNSGKLLVYEYSSQSNSYLDTPDFYLGINNDNLFTRRDSIFESVGNYFLDRRAITYPFSNISQEEIKDISYEDAVAESVWISLKGRQLEKGKLYIPGLNSNQEISLPVTLKYNDSVLNISLGDMFVVGDLDNKIDLEIKTVKNHDLVWVSLGDVTTRLEKGKTAYTSGVFRLDEPLSVRIFDARSEVNHDISEKFFGNTFNICWKRDVLETIVKEEKKDDIFAVTTKDAVGCNVNKIEDAPLSLDDRFLMTVYLPFRSSDGARPHFCVVEETGEPNCQNDEIFYTSHTSEDWGGVDRVLDLKGGSNYWIDISAKPPDTEGETWTIEYKSPIIKTYKIVSDVEFDKNLWDAYTRDRLVNVENSNSVKIFAREDAVDFALYGKKSIDNCSVLDQGSVSKELNNKSITYQSKDWGVGCDYVSLFDTSSMNSYIVRFSGNNKLGRDLKFYIYNKASNRNDIEGLLGSGEYDRSYALMDWDKLSKNNYIVNLESRSFGRKNAVNVLDRSTIYQVPLAWLESWIFTPDSVKNEGRVFNNLEIISSEKFGTHKYVITVSNSGLLELSQGYDDGWIAYRVSNQSSVVSRRLSVLFPWLFGEKLEHVKVNAWANGWLIQSSDISDQSSESNDQQLTTKGHTIIIVFWPQYLEYLGFVMLVGGFGVLVFMVLREKRQEKTNK